MMKSMIKCCKLIAAVAAILFFFVLSGGITFIAGYDALHIRPYLPQVRKIYSSLPPEEKALPAKVSNAFDRLEQIHPYAFVARNLIEELGTKQRKMSQYHLQTAMWNILLRVHFTKEEVKSFYAHYMRYEKGMGLVNGAKYYFNKLPAELSLDEVVTLLVIARSPSHYSPGSHPNRLAEARTKMLREYSK